MKKYFKNLIKTAFIFVLGFVLTLSVVSADTTTSVQGPANGNQVNFTIHLGSNSFSGTASNKNFENRTLLLWKLDTHLVGSQESVDKQKLELVKKLANVKNEDLTKKYGEPIKTDKSDKDGLIKLLLNKDTSYYVREDLSSGIKSPLISSFIIVVEKVSTGNVDIYNKYVRPPNPYTPPGKEIPPKKFVKVDYDDTSKVLEGAIFRVAVKQGDTYRTVIKKHLTYAVISNEKGEFTVEGLPKGTYYLIETKAPRGYRQLASPIEFTIDDNSENNFTVTQVKNKLDANYIPIKPQDGGNIVYKYSTNKIVVPKTGDIMLLLLTIGGGLLAILGHLILRDEKNSFYPSFFRRL